MKLALVFLMTSLALFVKGQVKPVTPNLDTRATTCRDCNFKGNRVISNGTWIAQIELKVERTHPNGTVFTYDRFCVGSIIGDKWILTSASCIQHAKMEEAKIYIGSKIYEDYSEMIRVENWYTPNPKFDSQHKLQDIALIKLKSIISFDDTVKKVNVAIMSCSSVLQNMRVASWDLKQNKKYLLYIDSTVYIRNRGQCIGEYGIGKMSRAVLCGKVATTTTCPGNIGAPLYLLKDGQTFLYGIFSMGINTCTKKQYALYTSVSEFSKWLQLYVPDTY